MDTDKKEASKQIADILKQAQDLLHQAECIADEAGVDFSWHPFYGGGGWYVGKESEDWSESDADEYGGGDAATGYWRSSSHNC